jgi:hypothetical protein
MGKDEKIIHDIEIESNRICNYLVDSLKSFNFNKKIGTPWCVYGATAMFSAYILTILESKVSIEKNTNDFIKQFSILVKSFVDQGIKKEDLH